MSVQMTIRLDDEVTAFVDEAAMAGIASRADVIGLVIEREIRRRSAERDAQIWASRPDPDLETDGYGQWAAQNATRVWSELDGVVRTRRCGQNATDAPVASYLTRQDTTAEAPGHVTRWLHEKFDLTRADVWG